MKMTLKIISRLAIAIYKSLLFLAIIVAADQGAFTFKQYLFKSYYGRDIIPVTVGGFVSDLTGHGTGFKVMHHGKPYIVTNKHVCELEKVVYDKRNVYPVIYTHPEADLCIIKGSHSDSRLSIATGYSKNLPSYLVGYPAFYESITVEEGVIRHLDENSFALNIVAYPGNSGSPLMNIFGEVVGVLRAGVPGSDKLTFAVNLKELRFALDQAYVLDSLNE